MFACLVKGSVAAQNYVLPYPEAEGLFTRTKRMKGRGLDVERKSRHIWAAVWVEDEGLAGLFQDLALKRKCLAYDIYQIIEKAKEDRVLRMGGRLKANADVEPTMPCTTLYTTEWHSL
jgi:hypothetical protein